MEQFLSIKRQIAGLLADRLGPYGVKVTEEFPAGRHARPGGCCIAVGLGGVGLPAAPCGAGQVRLTLRMDILCPAQGSRIGCHEAFELLCGALAAQLGVREISCGGVSYDRGFDALCMTATAALDGVLTGDGPDSGQFEEIVIRARIA